jgi:acyl-ACP thioesterase
MGGNKKLLPPPINMHLEVIKYYRFHSKLEASKYCLVISTPFLCYSRVIFHILTGNGRESSPSRNPFNYMRKRPNEKERNTVSIIACLLFVLAER